ncbi:MAG: twin-arginine translocase subunit TatC [Bacteroidales bacterium]|nr:twin-arginine translocase subunit TatC [Bacteroidales bacterium]
MSDSGSNFWSHLEVFRWVLVRCLCVVLGVAIVAFLLGDFIFDRIVFAPCRADFVTYEFFCRVAAWLSIPGICPTIEEINIININLTAQFFTHISISFYIGLIIGFPYLMIELWYFVLPALYPHERKPAIKGAVSFVALFFAGVLTAYFLIFPLALNFLGTYQVSENVPNQISLNSYISTFLTLIFLMGLVFEMPVVAYFLAKIGLLKSGFFKKYRRHSIVAILILAAFITPSPDVFTMFMIALPLQLLYELSRLVVKRVERKSSL